MLEFSLLVLRDRMDKGVNIYYLVYIKLYLWGVRMGWFLCGLDYFGMIRVVGLGMVGFGIYIFIN